MWSSRRRLAGATAAAGLTALAVGVPTDVIDTDFFTRMTPVRWWDYPVLVLVSLLTGLWVAIPPPARRAERPAGVVGAATGALFAIGCPICNKIIVALLGVSGALAMWAPVQPFLAALSVAALGGAVYLRWRRRACAEACSAERDAQDLVVADAGLAASVAVAGGQPQRPVAGR